MPTSLTLTEKKSYGSLCFTRAIIIHYMTKCKDGGNDHGFLYLGICFTYMFVHLAQPEEDYSHGQYDRLQYMLQQQHNKRSC